MPRPVFHGFKDESIRALPAVADKVPAHCIRIMTQTPTGPTGDLLVDGDTAQDIYGKMFDQEGKWFSHQTVLAKLASENAALFYMSRMVADDAEKPRIALCLEKVTQTFAKYQRNPDTGKIITDNDGNKLTDDGTTFDGTLFRWILQEVPKDKMGQMETKTPGTLKGKEGSTSTVYPILELHDWHLTAEGNNTGFKLYFPHSKTVDPADSDTVLKKDTLLFRMEMVRRENAKATGRTVETLGTERHIDISFKPGVKNPNNGLSYSPDRIVKEYSKIAKGSTPKYGPIGAVYVYQDNIDAILTEVLAIENTNSSHNYEDKHLVNIFTGVNWDGEAHESIRFSDDSLPLNRATTHYMRSGSDGTVSSAKLDELVRAELTDGWERSDNPVKDALRYQFSAMYDTGFSIETKYMFFRALSKRPDISVTACTSIDGKPDNSAVEDDAMAQLLINQARLSPESTLYGTPTCRAVICRSTMDWKDDVRKDVRSPLLYDLADKRLKYMGAATGIYKKEKAYDIYPANVVNMGDNVTNTYVPESLRAELWDKGVNGVESAGLVEDFWPAVRTVMSDPTSVLTSDINMLTMTNMVRQAYITWARHSGNSRDTDEQLKRKKEKTFIKLTEGKYDNRVTITPTAYSTPADVIRGFSESMDIVAEFSNMKTVDQFNLIARRRTA